LERTSRRGEKESGGERIGQRRTDGSGGGEGRGQERREEV
jgi:hypothetical protein